MVDDLDFPFGASPDPDPPREPAWKKALGWKQKQRDKDDPDAPPKRKNSPRHVEACKHNRWSNAFWRKDNADQITVVPYRCGSWRHKDSPCAKKWGQIQFNRLSKAMNACGEGWLYLVLTFRLNPNGSPSYIPKDPEDAYRQLWRMFVCFKETVCRRYASTYNKATRRYEYTKADFGYISLVERHRSGYPHLNVLIFCPKLYAAAQGDGWTQKISHELRDLAVHAGFGEHLDPQKNGPVQSHDALAGYFVKMVTRKDPTENSGLAAEFTKQYQVPDNAPIKFRRLRASRGMLPPPAESTGEWEGGLINGNDQIVTRRLLDLPPDDQAEIPTVVIERPRIDVLEEKMNAAREFARARAERRKAALDAGARQKRRRGG